LRGGTVDGDGAFASPSRSCYTNRQTALGHWLDSELVALVVRLEEKVMPKLKTHKNAAKRFEFSGSGKMLRSKALKNHLRRNKSNRTQALFGKKLGVAAADVKRLSRLVPYGA
jgi:large subunit ribosomal protein L35